MNIDFFNPVRIFSGEGCFRDFDGYAAFGSRCLIVCGQHSARACGALCAAALSAGLLRLIWVSGGNLWLLPAAGGLAAACLKELSGWPGPRQGRRLRRSL